MQNGDRLERLRTLSPAKRALLLKKLAQQGQSHANIPAIVPRRRQAPTALSFTQQQFFYLYLLEPNSSAYNVPIALRLIGNLDRDALVKSIQIIIERHEILRTTFSIIDEQPMQIVAPTLTLIPQIIDVRTSSKADQVHAADAEVCIPFDLTHGPLFRLTIFRVGATEHLFLFTMHHIIMDGWSVGIFLQELATLYEEFVSGQPSLLPELSLQYVDHAIWQRQRLQGKVLKDLLAYWQQHLSGVPITLDLPTDHPRPSVQHYKGNSLSFLIPDEMRVILHQLSKAEGATLFMILLATFQVLLYRYSGQEDFLVGTPVANRTYQETEQLIGCFINTLVLRSCVRGNPPFRGLLQHVREECLGAYAHQDLPFGLLVDALQPERRASHNPLFQVMFVLQSAAKTLPELPGLQVLPAESYGKGAMFDLLLSLTETSQGIEGALEYNSSLFEASTMQRLHQHFLTLLQGIISNPDQRLDDLSLLTQQEIHYLLHELNPLSSPSTSTQCLHHLFEAQVQCMPDAIALVYGLQSLTYHELNRRADVLASHLQTLGVGPEVLVGICVPRSLELVISLLAILKAGGAYVPLDPTYPQERLAFLLADALAPVLITQKNVRDRLDLVSYEGKVLWLDELSLTGLEEGEVEASYVVPPMSPANCAYIIYTSGSTGCPKGIMVTHASAAGLIAWAQKIYTRQEIHRTLASTSICFDMSIFELFVPLSVGGSCIVVENALQLSVLNGSDAVTLVDVVPSVAREMLRFGGIASTVQTINLAGEALLPKLVQDLYEQTKASRVFNLYGPSEDTVYSTYALLPAMSSEPPLIGRPIECTDLYLLDQRLCLVPAGMPGEVYLGGKGLARGYLNRPDLTAERFVPNPFSKQAGARLYKTGDLARYQADGQIDYLGRIDHQVKVRGFRIELGEIETVLSRHPSVRESVVVVQNDEAGIAYLVAYVILQTDQKSGSDDLRDYLQGLLPSYMVPSAFRLLDTFPLTPNGKVDRRALSVLQQRSIVSSQDVRGPRDIIELRLVHLWETVLQKAPISVLDTFFNLGGNSFLAIQLMAQMQRQFECSIPLSELLQNGSIEHIAHLIRTAGDTMPQSPLVLLQQSGNAAPFFCIHPAGGSVVCYMDLARYLGRPFYGLQVEGLYEGKIQPRSVEEMAAQYIVAIRSVQPQGPYFLGGWSLGGVIAFEMAQQLTVQGQDIATLVLIDSVVSALMTSPSEVSQIDMLVGFALHLGLSQKQLDVMQATLATLSWSEQWATLVEQLRDASILPADNDSEHLNRLFQVYQATIRAWLDYLPHQYQGALTLLRASDRTGRDDNREMMEWQRLVTGHLTVIDIPGDHYTLIRQPHAKVLAEHLRQCLGTELQPDQQAYV